MSGVSTPAISTPRRTNPTTVQAHGCEGVILDLAGNHEHDTARVADQPQYVVRAGIVTPAQLRAGTRFTVNGFGFSVQTAAGISVDELARGGRFPNRQISVTTLQELRNAGLVVNFRTPGAGAYHGTVIVPTPLPPRIFETIAFLFTQRPNPFPVP